jgi:adenosylcobinamide-GDP ribazoletransferase
LDDFIMGLRFFTRLPAGDAPHEVPNLGRMAPALPFVSLAVGFLPALLLVILSWSGTPTFAAATLAVAVMIALTGAMPEDAVADAADGLFGGNTVERRLEIMKDSRHGTYGIVAIVIYVVLRVTAYGAIAAINPLAGGGLMLAAAVVARWGALWLNLRLPAAREGGAAASAGRVGRAQFWIGTGFAAGLLFVLAGPFAGLLGVILVVVSTILVAAGWVWTCRRLVGGQTGDLIGALHGLIEMAMLVVLVVLA